MAPSTAHAGVHVLISRRARQTPDRIAAVAADHVISYAALDEQSDCVAGALVAAGVRANDVVALAIARSVDMLIALLGALKAGAAYLPLDIADPEERIAFVLADSRARLILTDRASADMFGAGGVPALQIRDAVGAAAATWPGHDVSPAAPAYVIYTSGSTGRPKGVAISHAALTNHTAWMQSAFPLSESDVVLQKTPVTFDASVWEILSPLAAGARLVLAPQGAHRDPGYLVRAVLEHAVTVLQLVPTQLALMLREPTLPACTSLARVFCGGEVLPLALQKRVFEALPACTLVNLYGPTECTIDATAWTCCDETGVTSVPIGCPIDGVSAYVLDGRMKMSPIGVPGELHIGGAGVGIGYLHRPALTAERFVPDPLGGEPGARLYRTGDLARWDADGHLDYIGRADQQIKLRGFRIELGEIEAALAACPGIARAVAVLHSPAEGDQRLIAYVTAAGAPRAAASELRDLLEQQLPYYMIPNAFVWLDELPRLSNGKVDRSRLPDPAPAEPDADVYVAPSNAIEERIAEICASLLGVDRVSMTARFFDMGGHSLLLIQLASRLRDAFGVEVRLRDLFNCPTVPDMVEALLARLAETETAGAAVD